jgi:hypothetical protein
MLAVGRDRLSGRHLCRSLGKGQWLIALLLLLAWMPALTFAGHWSDLGSAGLVGGGSAGDTVFLALAPHTHLLPGGSPLSAHLHSERTTGPDPHGPSSQANDGHAEHGHGGAGATGVVVAIVPQPVSLDATPVLVAAEPVVNEATPAPHHETPPAPPPRSTVV